MALSEQDKVDTLRELFNSERVKLKCGKHLYFGPIKDSPKITPAMGCPDCWKIFYIHEMATTPPSERGKKLAEIEEVMADVVQLVESGRWDFLPYDHAQISIGPDDKS